VTCTHCKWGSYGGCSDIVTSPLTVPINRPLGDSPRRESSIYYCSHVLSRPLPPCHLSKSASYHLRIFLSLCRGSGPSDLDSQQLQRAPCVSLVLPLPVRPRLPIGPTRQQSSQFLSFYSLSCIAHDATVPSSPPSCHTACSPPMPLTTATLPLRVLLDPPCSCLSPSYNDVAS
jgi:hypothetical protein